MNWLDWVLVASLGFSIISGLKKGLVKTVFGIAGMVVGIILASRYYNLLAPNLTFISQENLAKIAAFVIIVAAISLIANILGAIFKKIVSMLTLGWVDRLSGAVLGLALGAISLGVTLALLIKFSIFGLDQIISQSWLAALLLKTYPLVKNLLPMDFGDLGSFF